MLSQFDLFYSRRRHALSFAIPFAALIGSLGAASAQIIEDEEFYRSLDKEAEEDASRFYGRLPPSVRRDAEAAELFLDEGSEVINEEFGHPSEED